MILGFIIHQKKRMDKLGSRFSCLATRVHYRLSILINHFVSQAFVPRFSFFAHLV